MLSATPVIFSAMNASMPGQPSRKSTKSGQETSSSLADPRWVPATAKSLGWSTTRGRGRKALVQAKAGGGRADAEGQAEEREGGEPGAAAEDPQAEAQVLQRGLEERQAALFAVGLPDLLDPAELAQRLAARLLGREA